MKDISLTPFKQINLTQGLFIDTQVDLEQILCSILPGEEFSKVILHSIQCTNDFCSFYFIYKNATVHKLCSTSYFAQVI